MNSANGAIKNKLNKSQPSLSVFLLTRDTIFSDSSNEYQRRSSDSEHKLQQSVG